MRTVNQVYKHNKGNTNNYYNYSLKKLSRATAGYPGNKFELKYN